ncbi:uncharacterized protein LOC142178904 [Nicotiana tabacum]|uniref:Uncharacterized protein LOC142178904 n=1 Tax=Nicotiana tabacum TaxID=4097 RepID=A0AC58U5R0_TOBAC
MSILIMFPYTSQQNGVVERKQRHIFEVARALSFQSCIPSRFWGDCIKTVVSLINKWPTSLLHGKSPYEILYNKLPAIDHLKVFGCLCFASNLPKGDKFAKRARKSVLIGYSEVQKGYRLFDLETNSIFVSGDVSFREHSFPFRENTTTIEDCFPIQTTVSIQPDYSSSASTTTAQESYPTIATDVLIPPRDNDLVKGDVNIPVPEMLDTDSTTPNTEAVEEIAIAPHTSRMAHVDDQGPRKTTRTSKPVVWLKDYQTTKKFTGCCLYPLSNTLTYANLSSGYQAYLEAFSAEVEPSTFQQASNDSRSVAAMKEEIKALEENNTWEIVDLPAGKQAIGSKWVYKIKYKSNGEV